MPPDYQRASRVQWQRVGLVIFFLLTMWEFLRLFSSILMPFVVAAGVAYFLDPAVSRLDRLGIR